VPRKSSVCPECGSDASTGWNDAADEQRLGITGDHFDYDEFVEDEFGSKRTRPRIHWIWYLTAALALAGFIIASLRW
jgi:hypothetical protein